MSPTNAHLEALNGPQRRAVTYGEPVLPKGFRSGPLLIVAGAGTGKTSTLAARVAHLVINGVDPGRILMLTFTPLRGLTPLVLQFLPGGMVPAQEAA
jgi:DNA helicase-2/ATP-dependent DNA helicase PcrA